MALRSEIEFDGNHLPPVSRNNQKRPFGLNLNLGWISRLIVSLVLLVVILVAQHSSFPGSGRIRGAVSYALNTNYDVTPWLQKYHGAMFWEDFIKPVTTEVTRDSLEPNSGLDGVPSTSSQSGLSNQADLSTLQPFPKFIYPVAAGKVVGRFDPQGKTNTNANNNYLSAGITIETSLEQKVKAGFPGTVIAVTGDQKYGYSVQVDHGQGVFSITKGCSTVQVIPGNKVTLGQDIGSIVLNDKDQNQIYLEIRVQGKPVDPLIFIQPGKASTI